MSTNNKKLIAGIPKETFPGERRVALVPDAISNLIKSGIDVQLEKGAGTEAGFLDTQYEGKGGQIVNSRDELFSTSDVILQVRTPGANPVEGRKDLDRMYSGQVIIGLSNPLSNPDVNNALAERGVIHFSMELMPRITRAQSMDALSSMSTVAGYKAVLIASTFLPRMFPMFMTAAGTITPARVFVIGAGVAGLQAIATAKRLGAVVSAYDVRPAVKEQVETLGARFVELDVDAGDAEEKGGYAREMGEEFYRQQREMMTRIVSETDVVVTTAAVPGKRAPVLITEGMITKMAPGSVVVDLAAEQGGNCELTKANDTIVTHGVTILGPTNLPATVPYHSSQMYARNITAFLLNLVKEGALDINMEDVIIRETLVTKDEEIINARVRELLGLT